MHALQTSVDPMDLVFCIQTIVSAIKSSGIYYPVSMEVDLHIKDSLFQKEIRRKMSLKITQNKCWTTITLLHHV